jgi:hypothetical protein
MTVGEKGQMGRRPLRGERAKPCTSKTLRSRVNVWVTTGWVKDARGVFERET